MRLIKNIAISLLLSLPLITIGQGFTPGVFLGILGSQVDGDRLSGYNKPGAYLGLLMKHKLTEKTLLQTEIEFIQKGSRQVIQPDQGIYYSYKIKLNYIEVPILYQYIFKEKYIPEAGLGFAYLINSEEVNNGLSYTPDPPFKKYELSGIIGLNYKLTDKININLRYSYSIIPIRKYPGIDSYYFNRSQSNNLLCFGVYYGL